MSLLHETPLFEKEAVHRISQPIELDDGATTTVHMARYDRNEFIPRLVLFERATRLLDWCEESNQAEALVGGFFLRESNRVLGETWINGARQPSVPITSPWDKVRGSIHIDVEGVLSIGLRNQLPVTPGRDLLQAGPVLVQNGEVRIINGHETEGVSAAAEQFDTDITIGRYPRAAIGINQEYIWSVVCDGRSRDDAGMTLEELALYVKNQGAEDVLNLDGGGSASLVSDGILMNRSRGDGVEYLRGRPIYTAIALYPA